VDPMAQLLKFADDKVHTLSNHLSHLGFQRWKMSIDFPRSGSRSNSSQND
jgi:hypothetical protein